MPFAEGRARGQAAGKPGVVVRRPRGWPGQAAMVERDRRTRGARSDGEQRWRAAMASSDGEERWHGQAARVWLYVLVSRRAVSAGCEGDSKGRLFTRAVPSCAGWSVGAADSQYARARAAGRRNLAGQGLLVIATWQARALASHDGASPGFAAKPPADPGEGLGRGSRTEAPLRCAGPRRLSADADGQRRAARSRGRPSPTPKRRPGP